MGDEERIVFRLDNRHNDVELTLSGPGAAATAEQIKAAGDGYFVPPGWAVGDPVEVYPMRVLTESEVARSDARGRLATKRARKAREARIYRLRYWAPSEPAAYVDLFNDLLEMHSPDDAGDCRTCLDAGGDWPADWPCATWLLLETAARVEDVPDAL